MAKFFSDWGAVVISGDEIGHKVAADSVLIRKRLAQAFGNDILTSGGIDRVLLAHRAFASPALVLTLNRIVHPALIQGINRAIQAAKRQRGVRAIVVDAALLVEWSLGRIQWDYLVGVSAPYEVRIQRLRPRGLTLSQIRQFSKAQMPWSRKRAYCDLIVKNDSSVAILRHRARLCWDKMLSWD